MVKIAVDAGHAFGTAGKRTPAGEREWTFNNQVALALIAELNTYSNVQILRVDDPTGKTDVPLSTRASRANAWGADIYISIHHNANTGKWGTWTGVETYVMSGSTSTSGSMKLAKLVHPGVVSAMGIRDRGIKSANFAVLRETRMPAILTEGGYMDSTIDIVKMRNATVMRNQGRNIATGAAKYFGLKKKSGATTPSPTTDPMSKGYLAEGDQGASVKTLQQNLNKLASVIKISKISEDGVFGSGTLAALKKFQSHFKLEVDGFYGAGSQAKMKTELGKLTAASTDNLYRVRKLWSDAASQIGAFSDLDGAKELADKNIAFNVYDGKGNVVYNPREARDAAIAKEKAQAEAKAKAEAAKKTAEEKAKAEAKAAELAKSNANYKATYEKAVELGITDGSRPHDSATREQVAVMIIRALQLEDK